MRTLLLIFISILTIFIIWINIKLYSENYTIAEKKADIILQLNFLQSELKYNNLGERMQQIFPEGIVFVNSLYGLSWCELAIGDSSHELKLKNKAINEALLTYNTINSVRVKSNFDKQLKPEYGIFYQGWRNYLLSKILRIDTVFEGHEKYITVYKTQCDSICEVLKNSESPYLQSYNSQSWPADMFVAIASLSNYDKIFKSKYERDIQIWLGKVKERLDPSTKMIPHQVDPETGKSIYGSRGSSMSLILRMLAEVEPDFGQAQFELFNEDFISTTFGLPSIREYPKGQRGRGDIDSGPVIFGVGFSATISSIGALSDYDSGNLKDKLYKTVNAFGLTVKNKDQKKYLFGGLPIADAFIAWGRATNCNENHIEHKSENWRIKFQLISLIVVTLIWQIFFINRIYKMISKIW